MTITIPFHSNKMGLAALLVNLQPQLKKDDYIYLVDNSPNQDGLKIAKQFGNSQSLIIVETGNYSIYQSWNFGLEFMLENKQEGTLVLNDDVLLSQTLITNLKKAHTLSNHLALVPKTPSRKWKSERLDPNFRWFNKSITAKDITKTNWLCGFAFYLKNECVQLNGVFDTDYKVWFGDTDYELRLKKNIGLINNEYIYHYGGLSYDYSKQEIFTQIGKDRELFIKKHPGIGKILRSKAGKPD